MLHLFIALRVFTLNLSKTKSSSQNPLKLVLGLKRFIPELFGVKKLKRDLQLNSYGQWTSLVMANH